MKRIIFTVINDLNYDQRMIRICSSLQEEGFDCVLIGRRLRNSSGLQAAVYKQKRLNVFFQTGKWAYIEYNLRLLGYLLWHRFDAVCSIDCDTVMPGLWATTWKSAPHIFDAHELFTDVPEVARRPAVKRVWEWVQKRAFRKTDLAYTVGPALARHFELIYGCRVEVIRNMPWRQAPVISLPAKEKFILYQGALNEGRGLEELIHAMQDIPLKLKIAGEGDLGPFLRMLVQDLGLTDKIEFLGFVLPSELPVLSRQAWLGMNVSRNVGLSYYLSLNNKFFDYVQAGLPSLINPFPEYMTLNRQYAVGVMCEAAVSDIVANVNSLLNAPAEYEKLKENCNIAGQELCWENESRKLIQLYRDFFEE